MILQALKEYYDRKPNLAPPGWIRQRIDYVIVLDDTGSFKHLDPMQETRDGRSEGLPCLVPNIGKQALKHTNSGTDANLLWDNAGFVLGIGNKGKMKIESFIKAIDDRFPSTQETGLKAVLAFLKAGIKDRAILAPITENLQFGEAIKTGRANMTFRLLGDDARFVFERPYVKDHISRAALASTASEEVQRGVCLITGERNQPIELCHPVIKGLRINKLNKLTPGCMLNA